MLQNKPNRNNQHRSQLAACSTQWLIKVKRLDEWERERLFCLQSKNTSWPRVKSLWPILQNLKNLRSCAAKRGECQRTLVVTRRGREVGWTRQLHTGAGESVRTVLSNVEELTVAGEQSGVRPSGVVPPVFTETVLLTWQPISCWSMFRSTCWYLLGS